MVAINDSGGVKQASHLVKYDSILGTFDAEVKIVDDTHMSIDGKSIEIVSSRDPLQLPWKKLGVQLVIEDGAKWKIAQLATEINRDVENIGAVRTHLPSMAQPPAQLLG